MTQYSGIGVSPGVAHGPVFRITRQVVRKPVPASPRQVFAALEAVAEELERRASAASIAVAREVLEAQSMIARDPALVEAIAARLTEDAVYPDVRDDIRDAFAGFRAALASLGGYFAERVNDLDEIADRTIDHLAGVTQVGSALEVPSIIVADDLTPSDTAAIDLDFALALVVAKGGPTSHTAIVARGLGIPAIVGCVGVDSVPDLTMLLVDGREGVAITDASLTEVAGRAAREEALRARAAGVTGPGRLSDGTPVTLLANAGNVDGVVAAASAGAEGIGLFRTELAFLDRQTEPTIDEQVELYSSVFAAMAGRRVVVRTIDAGSDKPVPFIAAEHEENPALGVRGWRLNRIDNSLVDRQLQALAMAAIASTADVWVMAPMIATAQEARDFAVRARRLGLKHVGVMVETPAAAIMADHVLAEVNFGSLGTNDLTQYVMAADRLDARLSDLTTSWHPAVLRAIQLAANHARNLARPLGVCGEAAADPQLAAVLVGLGVSSLSMSPPALAEVRGFLAHVDRATCVRAAEAAVSAGSELEAKLAATEILGD
ncbi:MAG: phosphoenolpyruvate--protein phosphotransferase [Candidatus Nanopelagicales bacterium]